MYIFLFFLIFGLYHLFSGMALFNQVFAEGTYFYWNIESSKIWPAPDEGYKGSVLTEVPDIGETIQIQIFEELICRARINQMIKPRFVTELMRIECSSDGYVTSTFMDVICEASGEYRKLRNRQMEFANRQKPLFRTRQEWNLSAALTVGASSFRFSDPDTPARWTNLLPTQAYHRGFQPAWEESSCAREVLS